MYRSEGVPEEVLPDFVVSADELLKETIQCIFNKNNKRARQIGKTSMLHEVGKGTNLSLSSPNFGNGLAIEAFTPGLPYAIKRSNIEIGDYSPGDEEMIIYPELVLDIDMDIVIDAASAKRKDEIIKFNNGSKKHLVRTDYDHPDVVDLHREHNNYFAGTPLQRLIEASNLKSGEAERLKLHTDEYTRAAICLLPQQNFGATIPEHHIGLRVIGAYTQEKEFNIRQPVQHIKLATRDADSEYGFGFNAIEGIVDDYDLDVYSVMASDVIALNFRLSIDDLTFDTQDLGVIARPQN